MSYRLRAETPHDAALPLLLVDIDGVVSLWSWPAAEAPDGDWTLVDGIPHFLGARPAALLRALCERFELVWCSGWEEKANEHLPRLIGIGPLPWLSFDRPPAGGATTAPWKLAAIDARVGGDRAVAWVDDAFNPACHAWAAQRRGPTLLVSTDPAHGLTATQAAELATWAIGLAPPTSF